MDLLQATLIFLVILLSIFLSVVGIQAFLILKNLKQALDKFNSLDTGKPLALISKTHTKPRRKKRFYKKVL